MSGTNSGNKRSGNARRLTIAGIAIGAAATIVGSIIASPLITAIFKPVPNDQPQSWTVQVVAPDGKPVDGANVVMLFDGGPVSRLTDSNGVAKLLLQPTANASLRVMVEADKYGIYSEERSLTSDRTVITKLKEKSSTQAVIAIRVVDDADSKPLKNVKISLVAEAKPYSQITDDNGLTTLILDFPPDQALIATISVSTTEYEISNQNVTIVPNKLQDIRLNRGNNSASVSQQIAGKNIDTTIRSDTKANSNGIIDLPIAGQVKDGESITHTFSNKAGNHLYFVAIERESLVTWKLTDQLGKTVFDGLMADQEDVEMPLDGEYVLTVRHGGGGSDTRSYKF